MEQYNKTMQETFDTVIQHLDKQGKRAMSHNGQSCLYRAFDGCRCAFGVLIPDELYSKSFEHKSAYAVIAHSLDHYFEVLVKEQSKTHLRLISRLQQIHDSAVDWSPAYFRHNLKKAALLYKLNTNVLDTLEFKPADG